MIRQVGYERLGIFTTDTNVEDVIRLMFDSPIAIEEKKLSTKLRYRRNQFIGRHTNAPTIITIEFNLADVE
jgi:hypothetical protein